jgi:hypothetical protein
MSEHQEDTRLLGRNGLIWRDYCGGATQEKLAARYGLSQARVSEIISQVRDSIPEDTREEEVRRSLEMLRELRDGALEVYRLAPAPVFVGKDGTPARDPSTVDDEHPEGKLVRDHTGRLRALETAVKVDARIAQLLGLDAAQKMDLTVSGQEESAAARLAAEASARVRGDEGE